MPTVYFPQINSAGIATQRPFTAGLFYDTDTVDLPCGLQQQWGWIGTGLTGFPTEPLGKFEANFPAITDAEMETLRAFFVQMGGRLGEFTYLNPAGNLVFNSEAFSGTGWSGALASGGSVADPFGGGRARSTSGGSASCTLLPDGNANGLVLCLSLYVKPSSASQATLSITGAGSSVRTLQAGVWQRVHHSGTVSGASAVSGTIALTGSGSIFGAQAVPMPGPGGYVANPGIRGLHAKCRFDADSFQPRYIGPNQISLKLPIIEYF